MFTKNNFSLAMRYIALADILKRVLQLNFFNSTQVRGHGHSGYLTIESGVVHILGYEPIKGTAIS